MVFAYAALIVLAARNGGWLAERIAAAGRAAFTNYLGTSILMTTLFYGYGFGLFGQLSRIELWLPVLGDLGADAALVEALARPLPLRPARMAVAQPVAAGAAADAAARAVAATRLEPAEALIAGRARAAAAGAGRAGWSPPRARRSSGGRAAAAARPAAADGPGNSRVSSACRPPSSISSASVAERLGAELARLGLHRVRRAGRARRRRGAASPRRSRRPLSRRPRGNSPGCGRSSRRARPAGAKTLPNRPHRRPPVVHCPVPSCPAGRSRPVKVNRRVDAALATFRSRARMLG